MLVKPKSPKVLFFVAVDWFFCSHFIDRAKAAQDAGYEVVILTKVERHRATIESAGLRLIHLGINRRSINPLSALATLLQLIWVFRRERPDLIHQVALKPILLGSLAARISGIRHTVSAVVGGGYVFTSPSTLIRGIRPLVRTFLRFLLNPPGSKVIFENGDDLSSFVQEGLVRVEDAVLIKGAGVNADIYWRSNELNCTAQPLVLLPARLLWDKGIREFVEAARLLRGRGTQARFALVGDSDPGNRANIDVTMLNQWREEGCVELWGFCQNMSQVLAKTDIVCLPSYREGLPKVLLEAMAAGLPCVTTDVPGCREAVRNGENGLLVPPRDPEALARALDQLIQNPELRRQMGLQGRARVLAEFASPIICRQTLQVYEELIAS